LEDAEDVGEEGVFGGAAVMVLVPLYVLVLPVRLECRFCPNWFCLLIDGRV